MLKAITSEWEIFFVLVEENADLAPSRLVRHHNPARVVREDYAFANLVEGPLVEATPSDGFLCIEESTAAPTTRSTLYSLPWWIAGSPYPAQAW